MGSRPWNLALRFLLELAALGGLGVAGWSLASGLWRWLLVIFLPLTAAVLWGVFAVPTIRADRAPRRFRCLAPSVSCSNSRSCSLARRAIT